jgi:hypothetical protein
MKYILTIILFFSAMAAFAQPSKKERAVLGNSKLLMQTVFGTKDSLTLEKLFASTLSYVHSGGKAETRAEALHGIVNNKSVYVEAGEPQPYNVSASGDSLIVKHSYVATEKKANGTETPLNLVIEMVWVKEKGDWKLARRKATKVH